jgi:NAD(P)-dependent dehydrogenase (short-subunit alcohol dehydrogenase family)
MTGPLQDQNVLVIGRGGGLARAITIAARDAGARVTAAGRDQRALAAAYAGEPGISTETVDLTDEASIAALGKRLDTVGHVVSTASARARGRVPAVVRHQGDRPAHAGQAPGPPDDRRRVVRPVLRCRRGEDHGRDPGRRHHQRRR